MISCLGPGPHFGDLKGFMGDGEPTAGARYCCGSQACTDSLIASSPAALPDPLAGNLAVLRQLVDPKLPDPTAADFSTAVADILLALAK